MVRREHRAVGDCRVVDCMRTARLLNRSTGHHNTRIQQYLMHSLRDAACSDTHTVPARQDVLASYEVLTERHPAPCQPWLDALGDPDAMPFRPHSRSPDNVSDSERLYRLKMLTDSHGYEGYLRALFHALEHRAGVDGTGEEASPLEPDLPELIRMAKNVSSRSSTHLPLNHSIVAVSVLEDGYSSSPGTILQPRISDIIPSSYGKLRRLRQRVSRPVTSFQDVQSLVQETLHRVTGSSFSAIEYVVRGMGDPCLRGCSGSEARPVVDDAFRRLEEEGTAFPFLPSDMSHAPSADGLPFVAGHFLYEILDNVCASSTVMVINSASGTTTKGGARLSSVSGLSQLLFRYPKTVFVLMPADLSELHDAIDLCRFFSNCYVNPKWLQFGPIAVTCSAIRRCLASLPAERTLYFGSVNTDPDWRFGSWKLALENLVYVFSAIVEDGGLTVEEAVEKLTRWLATNTNDVFGYASGGGLIST